MPRSSPSAWRSVTTRILANFDGLSTRQKLAILSETRGLPRGLHTLINQLKQKFTLAKIPSHCRPVFHHRYLLSRLSHDGYRLGLCSNSVRKTVNEMIHSADLDRFFELTLSNEDIEHPKPNPEIYLTAAKQMNVQPDRCLVVEDNANGIQAARTAGMHVLEVADPDSVTYELVARNAGDDRGERSGAVNILIPIAGRDRYFPEGQFVFPKPLVDICGTPLIEHTLQAFLNLPGDPKFTFVVQEQDCRSYSLDDVLKVVVGPKKTQIVQIRAATQGAICSCLLAIDHIDPDDELLIANGDQVLLGSVAAVARRFPTPRTRRRRRHLPFDASALLLCPGRRGRVRSPKRPKSVWSAAWASPGSTISAAAVTSSKRPNACS